MIYPYLRRAQRIQFSKPGRRILLYFLMVSAGIIHARNSTAAPAYYAPMVTDVGATTLVSPASPGCYGSNESIIVTITNYTGVALDLSIDPVTVTVDVTGAVTQTLSTTINSGTIAANSTMNVNTGTLNMTTPGIYTFNATATTASDSNTSNDTMPAVTRTTYGLAALPQIVNFSGFTSSNLSTAFPGWHEASGTGAAGTTSFWTFQGNVGAQGNTTARINLFTTTRNEWLISPPIPASANTVLRFKAAVTDQGSTSNPDVMGPDDKVRVMISTDCGASWVTAMTFDTAYHLSPVLTQYGLSLASYAGQDIMIAFYATDGPVDDINNYDFHIDDINISDVNGVDMGITGLVAPSASGCLSSNETIRVNLRNHGFSTVDLSTDNVTVNVNVTGPNPQSFSVVVNSGQLVPGAVMPVTVSTTYDMSAAGIYLFNAFTSTATADYDPQNDAMTQEYITSTRPEVSVSPDEIICSGTSLSISATGTAHGPAPGNIPFTSTSAVTILDLDTVYSIINVNSPLYAFDVYSVTIDSIYHSYDADLDIYLIAPNGSRIELTSDNGTNGNNYMGTRFIASAPGSVITGSAPFTGDFHPEQPFSMLSGSANGAWRLQVIDDGAGDNGILKGWSINMKNSNSIASYSWSPAAGLNSTSVSNPVAAPASTTHYTVTVTDLNGCTATGNVLVTVVPSPVATATTVNASCNGSNDGSATVNASGGSGIYTYQWSNGETSSTAANLTAGSYSVTVTDDNMCSATVLVNISEPAVLAASVSSTAETCSPGNDGTATAYPSGGSGSYTYSWNDPASQTTPTATGLIAGTYTVTIDDGICPVIAVPVTVNSPAPPVVTVSNDTTICEGASAILVANGGSLYSWSNNAGSNDTISVSPLSTTVYTVTVTGTNGCTASGQITVNVSPLAAASFSYSGTGNNISFINGSSNASSYSWDFGDGSPLDTSNSPSYIYPLDGTYTVTLTASNACNTDTATEVIVIFTTGITEARAGIAGIAPNPSHGVFHLFLNNESSTGARIEIFDAEGRTVYSKEENIPGNDRIMIDVGSLAKGVYYLKVISGNSVSTQQVIIQ